MVESVERRARWKDDIVTSVVEVPVWDEEMKSTLFYNKMDYHEFQEAEQRRYDKMMMKKIQKMVYEKMGPQLQEALDRGATPEEIEAMMPQTTEDIFSLLGGIPQPDMPVTLKAPTQEAIHRSQPAEDGEGSNENQSLKTEEAPAQNDDSSTKPLPAERGHSVEETAGLLKVTADAEEKSLNTETKLVPNVDGMGLVNTSNSKVTPEGDTTGASGATSPEILEDDIYAAFEVEETPAAARPIEWNPNASASSSPSQNEMGRCEESLNLSMDDSPSDGTKQDSAGSIHSCLSPRLQQLRDKLTRITGDETTEPNITPTSGSVSRDKPLVSPDKASLVGSSNSSLDWDPDSSERKREALVGSSNSSLDWDPERSERRLEALKAKLTKLTQQEPYEDSEHSDTLEEIKDHPTDEGKREVDGDTSNKSLEIEQISPRGSKEDHLASSRRSVDDSIANLQQIQNQVSELLGASISTDWHVDELVSLPSPEKPQSKYNIEDFVSSDEEEEVAKGAEQESDSEDETLATDLSNLLEPSWPGRTASSSQASIGSSSLNLAKMMPPRRNDKKSAKKNNMNAESSSSSSNKEYPVSLEEVTQEESSVYSPPPSFRQKIPSKAVKESEAFSPSLEADTNIALGRGRSQHAPPAIGECQGNSSKKKKKKKRSKSVDKNGFSSDRDKRGGRRPGMKRSSSDHDLDAGESSDSEPAISSRKKKTTRSKSINRNSKSAASTDDISTSSKKKKRSKSVDRSGDRVKDAKKGGRKPGIRRSASDNDLDVNHSSTSKDEIPHLAPKRKSRSKSVDRSSESFDGNTSMKRSALDNAIQLPNKANSSAETPPLAVKKKKRSKSVDRSAEPKNAAKRGGQKPSMKRSSSNNDLGSSNNDSSNIITAENRSAHKKKKRSKSVDPSDQEKRGGQKRAGRKPTMKRSLSDHALKVSEKPASTNDIISSDVAASPKATRKAQSQRLFTRFFASKKSG